MKNKSTVAMPAKFSFTHCNKTLQFLYRKWGTEKSFCESKKCQKRGLFQLSLGGEKERS